MARRRFLKPTEAQLAMIRDLFRRWGQAGGKERASRLTPERRREIARLGGLASKKTAEDTQYQGWSSGPPGEEAGTCCGQFQALNASSGEIPAADPQRLVVDRPSVYR
jgi:hypothetical protein